MRQQALAFSACMRKHGLPNFPDPQFPSGAGRALSQRGQRHRSQLGAVPGGPEGLPGRLPGRAGADRRGQSRPAAVASPELQDLAKPASSPGIRPLIARESRRRADPFSNTMPCEANDVCA